MKSLKKKASGFNFFVNEDIGISTGISIVIPAKNEAENLSFLLERIDRTFYKERIPYEVILVNDYSTDTTNKVADDLSKTYSLNVIKKQGKPGKAQSLLEGFPHAKYDVICMIDADLQYPPESIPKMYKKIKSGFDIVIGDRDEKNIAFIRRFTSKFFSKMFGKFLHDFDCDVQSGLKLFRKEIIERIILEPSPWTFDLEFLLKAREAGYTITSEKIIFQKRLNGKSKVSLLRTSLEIGIGAIKEKMRPSEIIPFHPFQKYYFGEGFHYKGVAFIHRSYLRPEETAFFRLTRKQTILFAAIFLLIISAFLINWHISITIFFAIMTTIYFIDLIFNFFLISKSFSEESEITVTDEEIKKIDLLPVYTILCPLYKEANVLPQFIKAIESLDYPKNKLQIIILLEEDDKDTIDRIHELGTPENFEILINPNSIPKTKPKALNYGLQFAKGKYTVIYDAEDIPDPLQLKKVLVAFNRSSEKTVCIQAKLNFYNPNQNLLTRIFTAEYSLWFDLILTGLQSMQAPIPLGGTSNHFRTKDIKKLQGWDSFNVTEDCDLGIRLAKMGYRTAIVSSTTLEEANSDLKNWFTQRGRWIKGYIQTYLVHTRKLKDFRNLDNIFQALTFQLTVGGKVFCILVNPIMWITTAVYFTFRFSFIGSFIRSFFPAPVLYMGVLCLILGNFMYLYSYMLGAAKRNKFGIIKYAYLVPFYWLAMSISAWHALYTLILQPYYWAKTKHGLHLQSEKIKLQKQSIKFSLQQPVPIAV